MSVCLRLDLRSQLRERERGQTRRNLVSTFFRKNNQHQQQHLEMVNYFNENLPTYLPTTYLHAYLLPSYYRPTYYLPTYYLPTYYLPTT